jgi:hypothetical protein
VRVLVMALLLMIGTSVWVADPAKAAERQAEDHDQVVARAVVPSMEQPQGEVQVLRRGALLVVRTLLASRVLKRVVAAIDGREQTNWPESRDGFRGSIRYREELFRATETAWQQFKQRPDRSDPRQYLAIDFVLGRDKASIALALPQLTGDYGQLTLVDQQTLKSWRSPPVYVRQNILEIVKDSFHLDAQAAAALLAPVWPGPEGPEAKPAT